MPLLRLVLCAVTLPLVGTVELAVTMRRATAAKFANTMFRALANLFIPMCYSGERSGWVGVVHRAPSQAVRGAYCGFALGAGQLLEDASGDLPLRVYCGPWAEESARARRLRVMLLQAASREARVELRGLGRLNAHTGLEVLQRWFSVVNVLVSAQEGDADG